MTNGVRPPAPAMAYYDFYKTNGSNTTVYDDTPSMTRQEFKDECDINVLMKRYDQAGAGVNFLPRDPNVVPQYVDFANSPRTLMEYMDLMQAADKAFMTLPAGVRREFDNDPTLFVDFAGNPENLEQMREWGLAPPAKAPEAPAAPAPVVEPPAEAPAGGSPKPV